MQSSRWFPCPSLQTWGPEKLHKWMNRKQQQTSGHQGHGLGEVSFQTHQVRDLQVASQVHWAGLRSSQPRGTVDWATHFCSASKTAHQPWPGLDSLGAPSQVHTALNEWSSPSHTGGCEPPPTATPHDHTTPGPQGTWPDRLFARLLQAAVALSDFSRRDVPTTALQKNHLEQLLPLRLAGVSPGLPVSPSTQAVPQYYKSAVSGASCLGQGLLGSCNACEEPKGSRIWGRF